ncbi:MAG: UDP-N-acetylmuramoyl-tripeptide--D-alanyl-D-alanine ligase [Verrucomicrobiales bacterium]|nr:UDP-N-acetylmuramoyl-tripeptide--D-alanyl-D-alanine ligase [Verrucomicrobiales bacterium]
MIPVSLSKLASWAGGALIQGTPTDLISGISTDSRKVGEGIAFLALKGDRFDAHDFLEEVAQKGASALVVSSLSAATEPYAGGMIHVKDTLKALQQIAFHHRRAESSLRVIGITGSNGKTSTKDFLSAVLTAGGQVNKTPGNLNNHIGVPLTVLSGDESDQFGVWEMGMNHPGEIEVLAEIAGPNAAIITNIGTAHIEHMGSREAIALEKSELAVAVPSDGYCAMPVEDEFFEFVSDRARCEMIGVGISSGVVRAENVMVSDGGRAQYDLVSGFGDSASVLLPVMGRHMILNSLLAAAVGLKEGLSPEAVAAALSGADLSGGRLEEKKVGDYVIIDDSYNANPDSMKAALETLRDASVKGRRVAVFGFMGELGEHAEREHRALGARAVENGVDLLVTVSEQAGLINEGAGDLNTNQNFGTHEEAAAFLKNTITPEDLVLVKGSRAAAMEKVIEGLH